MNQFKIIKLIAAVLGSIGVVATTAQTFVNLNQMLDKHFWIVLFCAWLLSLIALWPKPAPHAVGFASVPAGVASRHSVFNYRWIILTTALFCIVGGYRFYEIYLHKTTTPVILQPIPAHSSRLLVEAVAKPGPNVSIRQSSRVRLRQFELGPATSFSDTESFFGAIGPEKFRTFKMRRDNNSRCNEQMEHIVGTLKEVLQRFAEKHDKNSLAPYIQSDNQVRNLSQERTDIAVQLIPKLSQEWAQLSDGDYATYIKWLSSCIGIRVPSFYVTLENLTNEEQLISKVIYRSSRISEVKGGAEGLLTPNVTYMHTIEYMTGDQQVSLIPPFKLLPKSTASFELQLSTKHPEWGLCWLMRIFFITEEGQDGLEGVKTNEFQLIMSGKPEPGQIE